MFVTKKRYEEEKQLADSRLKEFEKTLHELYEAHLELKGKYNELLTERNNILDQLGTIEQDISLRIGDKDK